MKKIEALQKVKAGDPIHRNTAKSLLAHQLITMTEDGGYLLTEDGEIELGAKLVIQQSHRVKDGLIWHTIGEAYTTRNAAEDAARLRSVADEADYRVVLEGTDPHSFIVYSFGIRYRQDVNELRTRETSLVLPTGDDDEPLYLFAVERNQGTGWQRFTDRLYTSQGDAEEAAATASQTKTGDYRIVPDDSPTIAPVMWRGGQRLPDVHLLRQMGAVAGSGYEQIESLVQIWTGD